MCGQCSRYSAAFGDCEYTEGGQSNGQMLEGEKIIVPDENRDETNSHRANLDPAGAHRRIREAEKPALNLVHATS